MMKDVLKIMSVSLAFVFLLILTVSMAATLATRNASVIGADEQAGLEAADREIKDTLTFCCKVCKGNLKIVGTQINRSTGEITCTCKPVQVKAEGDSR